MKKVFVLLSVCLVAISCSTTKKPVVYTNETVCLWLKPVDIDPDNINPELVYVVEGSKPNGVPVLVLAKGEIVSKIMKLLFDSLEGKDVGGMIEGNVFTCNNLGSKSIFTQEQISNGSYAPEQKETLLRNANTEKYELRSFIPLKAVGKIVSDEKTGYKITMVLNQTLQKIKNQKKETKTGSPAGWKSVKPTSEKITTDDDRW